MLVGWSGIVAVSAWYFRVCLRWSGRGSRRAPGSRIHLFHTFSVRFNINKLPAQSFTSDLVEDNLVLRFLPLPSQQSSTDDKAGGVQPMVTTLDDLSSCSAIIRRMKLLFKFFSFWKFDFSSVFQPTQCRQSRASLLWRWWWREQHGMGAIPSLREDFQNLFPLSQQYKSSKLVSQLSQQYTE